MPVELRIGYFAHSLRSDWNNGNAHFLRGLMRALIRQKHKVTIFEPHTGWSIENLCTEAVGGHSLDIFNATYPDLDVQTYLPENTYNYWSERLSGFDVVILHEWNSPSLARTLLDLRDRVGFKLLFHDTHHRASSSPEQINAYGLEQFDGILAFGCALRNLYKDRFGISRVWTFHEAADTTLFHPIPDQAKSIDVLWIGNWGEGDRSAEIEEFFLKPAAALASHNAYWVFGVRYPKEGLDALEEARVRYGGYLPNIWGPRTYASAHITIHIPRQQYSFLMSGIPTIRVFEALACGIPLISAPWLDVEELFRPGDICFVADDKEMIAATQRFLHEPQIAAEQARSGLETILTRHTCDHRAQQLISICEELLS